MLAAISATPVRLLAHVKLLRSEPATGSTLGTAPGLIRLVFSEKPELALTSVRLIAANGDTIALSPLRMDAGEGHVIVAGIPATLAPDEYRIAWSVASRDGHVVRGLIPFVVASARDSSLASGQPPTMLASPPAPAAASPVITGALGILGASWLGFVSLFIVIGVVVFRLFVLRRASSVDAEAFGQIASTNAATLGIAAAVGVLLSAVLRLGRESADMPDISLSAMLLGSMWGRALLLQIAASLVAAAAFLKASGHHDGRHGTAWRFALIAAAVLAISTSLGAHAAASDLALIAVPIDAIHIVAGSAWLGTLAVIVVVGIPAALKTPDATRPGARVAALINVFSPLALVSGGTIAATGLAASLINLRRIDALWTTPYGLALILKLVFVVLLFAAGAWNWRRMKPRLTGDDAIVPLRGMASLELLLATLVLGITAILVALELP